MTEENRPLDPFEEQRKHRLTLDNQADGVVKNKTLRSLEELDQIINTTMGGPALSIAAKEAMKLLKAYRDAAGLIVWKKTGIAVKDSIDLVDEEARKIAETKES